MSRRLEAPIRRTPAGTWSVDMPLAPGSSRRVRRTFTHHADAQAWQAAAISAHLRGQPLPVPDPAALAGRSPARATGRSAGTSLREIGARYVQEQYVRLGRAGGDRQAQVEQDIARIATWMEARGLVMETLVRDRVVDLMTDLAAAPAEGGWACVPAGVDPDRWVTVDEAETEFGFSGSTIKRRRAEGTLTPQVRGGRHVFRVGDLYAACAGPGGAPLRRGPRRRGLGQQRLQQVRQLLEQLMAYARNAHGIAVPQDREGLPVPRQAAAPPARPQPVTLQQTAELAAHLHAVHQVPLWLMRTLGLRISEAYGITLGDLTDLGSGQPGILLIRAQGGRAFVERAEDGSLVRVGTRDATKNATSTRVVVVPTAVMALTRLVVAVFHTDDHGLVDPTARLVPALTHGTLDHQGAFRTALHAAARAVGRAVSEESLTGSATPPVVLPHTMRKSLVSQLVDVGTADVARRRWFGHVAGDDVHLQSYYLDDPALGPAREVSDAISAQIAAALPGGLIIPTPLRCTTRNQPALHPQRERIDAALTAAGWLGDRDSAGRRRLGVEVVAAELGVSPTTTRRYLATFLAAAAPAAAGSWRLTWEQVEELRHLVNNRVGVRALAAELAVDEAAVRRAATVHSVPLLADDGGLEWMTAHHGGILRAALRPAQEDDAGLITIQEAAAQLGCSPARVMHLADLGRLRLVAGGQATIPRVRQQDVTRMLNRR